jgi:hypothetical protein
MIFAHTTAWWKPKGAWKASKQWCSYF